MLKPSVAVEPGPAGVRGEGAGVTIRGLRHSYGELRTIERLDLAAPEHGVLGLVGPSGCGKSTLLELISGLQEPGEGEIEVGGAREAGGRLARCAFMPQRDLLLPWLYGDRQRGAGAAQPRRAARRGAARGAAAVRALRPRRLRGHPPRASSPAGCASGSPSCARSSPASRCWPLDEPFASLDAITRAEMQELAGGDAGGRPAHRRPRQPRRRGGALPRRPRRGPLAAPGPRRRRAERAGAAGRRPRRGRRRPRLRRRAGAGHASPCAREARR